MFSLVFLLSVVVPRFVNGQIAQTDATCTSEYSWMGNSRGSSPCLVVAELDAQCNYGSWNLTALNSSITYLPPVGQYASLCTCSWASYNLISACTACQGYPQYIAIWGDYISGCSGKTTNGSYWPSSVPIPSDVKIPYWASTDPTTWTNQKFNAADAKTIYEASHPDLPTATSQPSPSTSSPTGAIVGGVIGGLFIIGCFVTLSFCILRRRAKGNIAHPDDRLAHMRKISDTTVTSGNATLADSSLRQMDQTPSISNVQRSTSISSLPFFSSLGRDSRAAVMGHTPAFQDPGLPPLEEVITPYTLPPTNDTPEKKHTDGEWPVFDQPNAPPQNAVRMAVTPSPTPPRKTGTNRFNPPAYSESDTATLSPMSRHQNQDSIDSTLSTPMATEASDTVRRIHTPGNSGSSIGHMGILNPIRASTSTLQTSVSTRRTSVGQVSMARGGFVRTLFTTRSQDTMNNHADERSEESFSPSEIA